MDIHQGFATKNLDEFGVDFRRFDVDLDGLRVSKVNLGLVD